MENVRRESKDDIHNYTNTVTILDISSTSLNSDDFPLFSSSSWKKKTLNAIWRGSSILFLASIAEQNCSHLLKAFYLIDFVSDEIISCRSKLLDGRLKLKHREFEPIAEVYTTKKLLEMSFQSISARF